MRRAEDVAFPPVRAADIHQIRLELKQPFETSFGRQTHHECVIVALHGENKTGWGEAPVSPFPGYSHEYADGAWHVLNRFLLPDLVRKDLSSLAAWQVSVPVSRGHSMARGAVEMALWDLAARSGGERLPSYLGAGNNGAPAGISIGLQKDHATLFSRIDRALRKGYERIKIKMSPGHDHDELKAIRDEFPHIPLMVDGNGAYGEEDLQTLASLDSYDLMMIEQPFPPGDFVLSSRLEEMSSTPVCLDETIESIHDARTADRLNSCGVLNIKPPRVAGMAPSLDLLQFATERGWDTFVGGLLETGIGRAHNVALASFDEVTLPGDTSASERYFETDIVQPAFTLDDDGRIRLPETDTGGTGVRVDRRTLDRHTIRRQTVTGEEKRRTDEA